MVRSDDPALVVKLREALERSVDEEPGCLVTSTRGVRAAEVLEPALASGTAAVCVDDDFAAKHRGVVAADGRAHLIQVSSTTDPMLAEVLDLLRAEHGIEGLAVFPLAPGGAPTARTPRQAVQVWQRSGVDALCMGPFGVTQGGR